MTQGPGEETPRATVTVEVVGESLTEVTLALAEAAHMLGEDAEIKTVEQTRGVIVATYDDAERAVAVIAENLYEEP